MKKSQVSSQVFIYILAAVIVGLILLVGYRAISTITSTVKEVDISELESGFKSKVLKISGQYKSVEKYEMAISNNFDEICFVDSLNENNVFGAAVKSNPRLSQYPFIETRIDNDVDSNVFLLKDKIVQKEFYTEKLDVEVDFLCLDNDKPKITVWLRGTGKEAVLYIQ